MGNTTGKQTGQESEQSLKDDQFQAHAPASRLRIANRGACCALLTVCTIAILLPFCGKAFNIDDTLFVLAAKNIAEHPLNPYGFQVVWEYTRAPMSDITQNPPLACYYSAVVGEISGWSEWRLHIGFLLLSVLLVLGTFRLANSLTRHPLMAAFTVIVTPGFLVSATNVMCDVMMLALWVWAVIFWIEGFRDHRSTYLISSVSLITAATLTKYFGIALIPLLVAYSLFKGRRLGSWVLYFLIPIAALVAYQVWSAHLYGHGLLTAAAKYAEQERTHFSISTVGRVLLGMSFAGGCVLTPLAFAPVVWRWRFLLVGLVFGVVCALSITQSCVVLGLHAGGTTLTADGQYGSFSTVQLALCIASGLALLALAIADFWEGQNAEALLLLLWVTGTFFFADFVNWTMNVRSVLPLVPAGAILLVRRIERARDGQFPRPSSATALVFCAVISVWATCGDVELANSARSAAQVVWSKTHSSGRTVWFTGHWGFQYYMEQFGAQPVDWERLAMSHRDFVIIPDNNVNYRDFPREYVISVSVVDIPIKSFASTVSSSIGAGFYSSYWGPLPFGFGRVAPEQYWIVNVASRHD